MSVPAGSNFVAFLEGVSALVAKEHERGFVDGMLAGVEICAEAGHKHRSHRPRRPHPHLRLVVS